ncbi:MAG: AsnC family transcriptional regulator [Candidatus Lokiarchaeota archaeon]|nr:AsnC family transcriptional regulator [Candidatus Lokiarchaeota archaeon]MBD3200122.1 AsnC family transcriptional regulator [Candidatus Lokiarchaeota archaeon]
MDGKDLQIAKLLLKNCRTTYREISEELDLSVNAIYKRVQNMIDEGLIKSFTAKPSLIALNGIEILIYGRTKSLGLEKLSKNLGNHESTYFIGIAAGNMIYINGYLRNISELHEYSTFVNKIGKLQTSTTCIRKLPYRITSETLTSLDYEILKVLNNNARRSVSDFADEVGVSAKTARKRIKKMEMYNLVDFSINFAPQMLTSQFHISLNPDKDYFKEFQRLNKTYTDNILYLQQFSNIPNLIMMTALTKTNQESANLHNNLQKEGFKDLLHHIFYNGYFFETWRDLLYREKLNQ